MSLFFENDEIEVLINRHSKENEVWLPAKVKEVSFVSDDWMYTIVVYPMKGYETYSGEVSLFEEDIKNAWVYRKKSSVSSDACTCSSLDLFHFGCKCGFFKKTKR